MSTKAEFRSLNDVCFLKAFTDNNPSIVPYMIYILYTLKQEKDIRPGQPNDKTRFSHKVKLNATHNSSNNSTRKTSNSQINNLINNAEYPALPQYNTK